MKYPDNLIEAIVKRLYLIEDKERKYVAECILRALDKEKALKPDIVALNETWIGVTEDGTFDFYESAPKSVEFSEIFLAREVPNTRKKFK